jgi:hypothetical protein
MLRKIKLFLFYFFGKKIFEKRSILYSHFEIIQYRAIITINAFLYYGKLEADVQDFFYETKLDFIEISKMQNLDAPKPV